jgi:uncharacterized protein YehS (DUF1456 family)
VKSVSLRLTSLNDVPVSTVFTNRDLLISEPSKLALIFRKDGKKNYYKNIEEC